MIKCEDTGEEIKSYNEYLKTLHWKMKRELILSKIKCCEVCLSEESLDIHHKTYKDIGNEKDCQLRVLCRKCHFAIHEVIKRRCANEKTIYQAYEPDIAILKTMKLQPKEMSRKFIRYAKEYGQWKVRSDYEDIKNEARIIIRRNGITIK